MQMHAVIVTPPGWRGLLLLFEHDEIQPGLPQARSNRQARRSGTDDRDFRGFVHARLPLQLAIQNVRSVASVPPAHPGRGTVKPTLMRSMATKVRNFRTLLLPKNSFRVSAS